jgi:hypothetical protein
LTVESSYLMQVVQRLLNLSHLFLWVNIFVSRAFFIITVLLQVDALSMNYESEPRNHLLIHMQQHYIFLILPNFEGLVFPRHLLQNVRAVFHQIERG